MNNTSINWTDFSSNLIRARRKDNSKTGHFCTHKNDKCRNCYAEAMNMRFGTGLEFKPANRDKIEFFFAEHEAINLRRMNASLKKKGEKKKVFLSSMTDLFHETMPVILIRKTFDLIAECENLIFQTLTKRVDVAAQWFIHYPEFHNLENLWFGLTPEDDGSDIATLRKIECRTRWLSLEPLLKPVDLSPHLEFLSWIVTGGESGPKARATNIDHLRMVVTQSAAAGIPVWVKQLGKLPVMREKEWFERNPTRLLNYRADKKILDGFMPLQVTGKGELLEEMPEDLRVRDLPEILTEEN